MRRERTTGDSLPERGTDDRTATFWSMAGDDLLQALGTSTDGLSDDEAHRRLPTAAPTHVRTSDLGLLARQFGNPIILILIAATLVSAATGDLIDASIILVIVLASGLLGFWQERGASHAVTALIESVRVTVTVRRRGSPVELPVERVVPGDIVTLETGDLVPGDCLLLAGEDVMANESALTGESYPVEKTPGSVTVGTPLERRTNSLWMGTYVVRGEATAVVVHTGAATAFGHVAASLAKRPARTRFEEGISAFGKLLFRVMIVLVTLILIANLLFQRPFTDSLLFSIALAVGLTPQLLPAIVSASLSYGARQMAKAKVIVKRLNAIEDFGGLNLLCSDKTGTLTEGVVHLERAIDVAGNPSQRVMEAAYLNAVFQREYANPVDEAIVAAGPIDTRGATLIDDVAYDFQRKRLSALVRIDGRSVMVTKGAFENVLAVCTALDPGDGQRQSIADEAAIRQWYERLGAQGYRVLGVASRDDITGSTIGVADETGMTFLGMLLFLDPPKADVGETVRGLADAGLSLRIVTGDNRFAARHVAEAVGLDGCRMLIGEEVERMTDAALAAAAVSTTLFTEVEPLKKERIVHAFRTAGYAVGYLGDGINDAPALHAADVGISVDTAVSVAREAASIVLLEKDLRVLLAGVRLGRRTFANTMKYIFIVTSANFGNMFSMTIGTLFLPFLPLLAFQILLLNLLANLPGMTIAADAVDPDQLERPGVWDIGFIRRFMILFGLSSSIFDLMTFGVLRIGFDAGAELFRSGWFLESVGTQIVVVLVLRTRHPFFRSRPGTMLLVSTAAVAVISYAIPYSPLRGPLGFVSPSLLLLGIILAINIAYVIVTELEKHWFYRRHGDEQIAVPPAPA
ncbi:MAG: magnesium-translocating P-type ATPase [Thermomicrobiales bacterium]